jgi:hypothetical protein
VQRPLCTLCGLSRRCFYLFSHCNTSTRVQCGDDSYFSFVCHPPCDLTSSKLSDIQDATSFLLLPTTSLQTLSTTVISACTYFLLLTVDLNIKQLPRLIKTLHSKRQKGPRKTNDKTSGCMRPEQVNKWSNYLIST